MDNIKIQCELLKKAMKCELNNKHNKDCYLVKNDDVWFIIDLIWGVIIPKSTVYINYEKMYHTPLSSTFLNVDDFTEPLVKTNTIIQDGKTTLQVFNHKTKDIQYYVDTKYLKYFNNYYLRATNNPTHPVIVYEDNIAVGFILPVKL